MTGPWQQRLAAKRQEAAEQPTVRLDEFSPGHRDYPAQVKAGEAALDEAIRSLGIIEAYRRYCGKSEPEANGQTESIMVSCPVPGHADRHPSAWLNTDRDVFFCAACQEGGDVYDLAAYHHALTGYRADTSGRLFHELRKAIGTDLGFEFWPSPEGLMVPVPPGGTPPGVEPPVVEQITREPGPATLHALPGGQSVDPYGLTEEDYEVAESAIEGDHYTVGPLLDYRTLCPAGTFMDSYVAACTVDNAPDEYHLANALVALSMVAGRKISLAGDGTYHPNVYICLLGETGVGKSRARKHLTTVLEGAMPYEPGDVEGAAVLNKPASGEALITLLRNEQVSPTGGAPLGEGDIRAYLNVDELSEILTKAKRQGSVLRDVLLELYDGPAKLSTFSISGGERMALRPYASVTTSIQPKMVRRMVDRGDVAVGLLNRFMFISGTEKPLVSFGQAEVDLALATSNLARVRTWLDGQRRVHGGDVVMVLDDDARKAWDEMFHTRLAPAVRGEAPYGDAARRIGFIAKKLLMLTALNQMRTTITAADVHSLDTLIDRLLHTAAYVGGEAGRGEMTTEADVADMEAEIYRWICQAYRDNPTKPINDWRVKREFAGRGWSFRQVQGVMETLRKTGALAEAQLRGTRGKGRPPKDPVVPTRVPVPPTGDAWVPMPVTSGVAAAEPTPPSTLADRRRPPANPRPPQEVDLGDGMTTVLTDELPKRPPRGPHSPQHKRNQEVLERLNGSQQGPETGGGAQLGSL